MKQPSASTFALAASLAITASANAALVLHLPLNDASTGGVTTAAAAINDGTHPTTAGTSSGNGDQWVTDATRGNVYFSNQGSRLTAGTQGIDRNVGFTWSLWVNIDPTAAGNSDGGADVIIGTRQTGGGETWHKVQRTSSGGWADFGYSGDLMTSTWRHLTYVGDATSIRMYIDGVFAGQDTTTSTSTYNRALEIGGSSQFTEDSEGLFSDLGVYTEALSVGEIKGLYDVTTAGVGSLNYDVGEFDLLKQVHDAGTGTIDIGGTTWGYATGLVGSNGLSGSPGNYTLILDSVGGTGLVVIPEPTAALLGGLGILALLRRRRA